MNAKQKNIKQEIRELLRLRRFIIMDMEMGFISPADVAKRVKEYNNTHARIFQRIQTVFRLMLDQIGHGDKNWGMSIPHVIVSVLEDDLEDKAVYLDFGHARVGGKKPGMSHGVFNVLIAYNNEIPYSWMNMTQPKLKAAIRRTLEENAAFYRRCKNKNVVALLERAGF